MPNTLTLSSREKQYGLYGYASLRIHNIYDLEVTHIHTISQVNETNFVEMALTDWML